MDVAGILVVAALEAFGFQNGRDDFDHFRITAKEDIGLVRVQRQAGFLFHRALFQNVLDAAGAAVKMRVLVGPRDAGYVGEVRAQAGQGFQFAAVAEIPTVTRAVQDDEFALRLVHENRPQHGNVGRQAGAGGDEDNRLVGRDAVNREHAAGFWPEKNPAAVLQGKQTGRQSAAGDECDIKLNIAALHAGRRDAVGAADHLVRFRWRVLPAWLQAGAGRCRAGRARRTGRA